MRVHGDEPGEFYFPGSEAFTAIYMGKDIKGQDYWHLGIFNAQGSGMVFKSHAILGKHFELIQVTMKRHAWIKAHDLTVCKVCGVVKRKDGKNKPCKGAAQVTFK